MPALPRNRALIAARALARIVPSLSNMTDAAEAAEGGVIVRGDATGFAQEILVREHRLHADEPVRAGGADRGPTPYDLLLAALGACTSMTIGLYARRKRLPLESITVRLRHGRIHASDCAECETKEEMIDRIDVVIELGGAIDDAQREELGKIAERCPVSRTLRRGVQIVSRVRERS